MNRLSPRPWLFFVAFTGVSAVGLALISQHHFDMQPCPWCTLQRMLFLLMSAGALLAALTPSTPWRRMFAAVVVMLAGSGIASALWQHFVAAKSASCALTLADRIMGFTGLDVRFPEVFEVRANCSEAAVDLLGVPYAMWSLALFAVLGLIALGVVLQRQRRA